MANRERSKLHPSTENWIKDLLSMVLSTRTRPSCPHSQSFPLGSLHKPLIFIHQKTEEARITIPQTPEWKTQWPKANQNDHMDYSLANSFATPQILSHQAPLSTGFSSKKTGVGYHFLIQGICLTQKSNPHLLHWQADSLPPSHLGSHTVWTRHYFLNFGSCWDTPSAL